MDDILLEEQKQEEFVKWDEGAALLGLKRPAFFYLVRDGQIASEEGRKKREGRYSLRDIMAIKEKRANGKPRKPHRVHGVRAQRTPVIFDWLSPLDIPSILKLDQIVYDQMYLAEAAVYEQWSKKNAKLAMAAFDARSERQVMLAYVAALPLPESVILEVMRHEREEIDIKASEMEDYDRPGAYTLLGNSAVHHPDRPDLIFSILFHMTRFWLDQYPERYITRIYAQSVSQSGDRMIQEFFMSPRYDLAPDAYMLDLARPGRSKVISKFQSQLTTKAPLPEELQHPYVPQPTIHAPIARKAISRPSGEHKIAQTDKEPLPDGFVPVVDMLKQYPFVPESSVNRNLGEFFIRGNWRASDGRDIKNAFDQAGVQAFMEFAKRYGNN